MGEIAEFDAKLQDRMKLWRECNELVKYIAAQPFAVGGWIEKGKTKYRVSGIKLDNISTKGKIRFWIQKQNGNDKCTDEDIKMKNYGDYTKITTDSVLGPRMKATKDGREPNMVAVVFFQQRKGFSERFTELKT